jgi:coenzyme Q-binding protein COQ10
MPVFRAMRRVPHSADEMFDLVADVERYHEFVPLCVRHAILSRETRGEIEILMTDMTVACGIYRESFKSRVTLDRANGCILSSRRMDRCANCEPDGHFNRDLATAAM